MPRQSEQQHIRAHHVVQQQHQRNLTTLPVQHDEHAQTVMQDFQIQYVAVVAVVAVDDVCENFVGHCRRHC